MRDRKLTRSRAREWAELTGKNKSRRERQNNKHKTKIPCCLPLLLQKKEEAKKRKKEKIKGRGTRRTSCHLQLSSARRGFKKGVEKKGSWKI